MLDPTIFLWDPMQDPRLSSVQDPTGSHTGSCPESYWIPQDPLWDPTDETYDPTCTIRILIDAAQDLTKVIRILHKIPNCTTDPAQDPT